MPTHDETTLLPPLERTSNLDISAHATCPPDDGSPIITAHASPGQQTLASLALSSPNALADHHTEDARAEVSQAALGAAELPTSLRDSPSTPQPNEETTIGATSSTSSATPEPLARHRDEVKSDETRSSRCATSPLPPPPRQALTPPDAYRINQHTSSFLRHGSKFVGTQQSDRQVYNVTVELKHVDMRESFLCGYLRIEGLTDQQKILTTYFEGEIIGTKYTFMTRNSDWGSNMKVDMQHWNRFPAWRPLARQAQQDGFNYRDYAQREHLFMRWKEHFLVPDHRVTHITGASFEGFYFICFNQVQGTISGIYFHSKSENRFQQLELKHVHDFGCKGAMEFA